MEGHRRAAPGPKPAPAPDRDGTIGGGTDRERLARLLDEAGELGVGSDIPLRAEAREATPVPPPRDWIRQATAAQMLAILSREPAGLIAAVLRIESWPWEASFLARLDPAVRERVTATLRMKFRVSGKLAGALRSVLEARLSAEPEPSGTAKRLREMLAGVLARWFR
jgi:hypothetical protein